MIVSYVLTGGVVHEEHIGLYPKNIICSIHSLFAIIGIIGLIFKIRKLYIGLLFFGILGLGHCLFDLASSWYSFIFLADPRVNPCFMTVAFLYPLFFYGAILQGYKLLKE